MSNEKMREEFERTSVRDTRRQPPRGNNYIDPMAQTDWLAFQKGWVQSRESLVIELPSFKAYPRGFVEGAAWMQSDCKEVIESLGLKVSQ